MRFDVLTLFPDLFSGYLTQSILKLALDRGLVSIDLWNIRDWAASKHNTVDDRPFGGGPGMVMLIDPLRACLQAARAADAAPAKVVYLSPQGAALTQAKVRELATRERLILLCGRYEGVDERLIAAEVDEELSIGDYVLSGGELAAAVVVDAVTRLQEGALNDAESAAQDSFQGGPGSSPGPALLDCPHYTRPVSHELGEVPPVLMSGNHAQIARWRRQQALGRTWQRRPDLLDEASLSTADRELLDAYRAGQEPKCREGQGWPRAAAGLAPTDAASGPAEPADP